VHHELSFLFHPVNALLVALLGAPSMAWQHAMGLEGEPGIWLPDHVVMSLIVVLVVAVLLIVVRLRLSLDRPSTMQQSLELLLSGLGGLCEDVIGHGLGKEFVSFITALTFFIFIANSFGLIFFLQPPTANTNTTFALSVTAFLYYNVVGLRRLGPIKYARQFVGPVWWLFPLMVPIEIISHLARILSLALRLFGNIFGDHTATGMFLIILPFFVPAMMSLGLLAALIQTFIFVMLAMVYIGGAVAVEH
jgi:F-type H+-transporting ATPase subunit a